MIVLTVLQVSTLINFKMILVSSALLGIIVQVGSLRSILQQYVLKAIIVQQELDLL